MAILSKNTTIGGKNPLSYKTITNISVDLNNFTEEGYYGFKDIRTVTNFPTSSTWIGSDYPSYLQVIKIDKTTYMQILTDYSGGMWIRQYINHWNSWKIIFSEAYNGSGSNIDADKLDGYHGANYIRNYGKTYSNFNSLNKSGFYQLLNAYNSPDGTSTLWGCIVFQTDGGTDSTTWLCQLAIKDNRGGKQLYIRKRNGTSWTAWEKVWSSNTDGSDSGLDADLLDGKHALNFAERAHSSTSTTYGLGTGIQYGHVRLSGGIDHNTSSDIDSGVAFEYNQFNRNENIDNYTTTGYYVMTSISSNSSLPLANDHSIYNAYGLLVLKVAITSSYNCCVQFLIGDSNDPKNNIYYRSYHENIWSNWTKLGSGSSDDITASNILTKLKTVDGSGSGLDADLLDNKHGYGFTYYGNASGSIPTNPTETSTGSSSMYRFQDTNNIIGEGTNVFYGVIQIYYSSSYYVRLAISMTSGKVYRQTNGTTAWNEISTNANPTIPIVTSDPTTVENGQLWIRSDL